MDFTSIEKFIKTVGITIDYEISRDFIKPNGLRCICVEIIGYYKHKITYDQYHCYEFKGNGKISYDEGNKIMGPSNGIFVYLGDDRMVDIYFEERARAFALKEFMENDS